MLPNLPVLEPPKLDYQIAIIRPAEEKPEPKKHIVQKGETLTSISELNGVTNKQVWDANPELKDPDLLDVNYQLKIPLAGEILPDRPYPQESQPEPIKSSSPVQSKPSVAGGNTYSKGYCTWGVKNWRPDIPNGLGNANQWFSRAANMGMAVGYTPRAGAVAVTKSYSHVALVVNVQGNQVYIKEMNYEGRNVTSYRLAPIDEFRYIY